MRWLVLVLGLMLPGTATAQIESISVLEMDTRFGRVDVVGPLGVKRLTLDGTPIDGVENWSLNILGSFGLADEPFDYLLVSDHAGANACDPPIRLLRIGETGAQVGPLVGGWVLGGRCMDHNCGTSRGAWSIRIADGERAAATMDASLSARNFGVAASDPVFRNWIAENAP